MIDCYAEPVGSLLGVVALLSGRTERDVDDIHLLVRDTVPERRLLYPARILPNAQIVRSGRDKMVFLSPVL